MTTNTSASERRTAENASVAGIGKRMWVQIRSTRRFVDVALTRSSNSRRDWAGDPNPNGKRIWCKALPHRGLQFIPSPGLRSPSPIRWARHKKENLSPFFENSRDWICRTFIGRTTNMRWLFLLPGGEGQDEGGQNTFFNFTCYAPNKLKPEHQHDFHAGCCCVKQCSEPEPSTRSTACMPTTGRSLNNSPRIPSATRSFGSLNVGTITQASAM